MEKILALYDSDVFYATRFMEYFIKKNETDLAISVFTRKESLEDFLQENQVEILLLGDPLELEERFLNQVRNIYQLTETSLVDAVDTLPSVNKYQSVSSLITEILKDYSKKATTQTGIISKQIKIITIFSPISGVEKVSYAWSLSTLLSQQEKTLLVLMELLPVPLLSVSDSKKHGLTDFIYYLKENTAIDKLDTLTGTAGKLNVLSGILHGADLLSLSREDILRWTNELSINSGYQSIVFYLDCYTEATIELMMQSDVVFVTTQENYYELAVMEEWERQMNQIGVSTGQEKFRVLRLHSMEREMSLPLTFQELMASESWAEAENYLH